MYLKVKVKAGVKEDKVEKVKADELRVSVRAEAKRGMANKRVVELVAEYLGIPLGKVIIINGHNSPSKLISVRD